MEPQMLTAPKMRAEQYHVLADGKETLFTNGCFDNLRSGRLTYLTFAQNHGDARVAGFYPDALVKAKRGALCLNEGEEDRACEFGSLYVANDIVFCDPNIATFSRRSMLTEETTFSEPSWQLQSDSVQIAVTHLGAHIAPVHFSLPQNPTLQPYYISPWQCEEHSFLNGNSESVLRGDFFCLPFGKADSADRTPSHGRTSSARWSLMEHRPTQVFTSRVGFGMTFPWRFGEPANAEYQSRAMGADFISLHSVPSIFKDIPNADCSRFPSRRGFTDLLQVAVDADPGQPAWSAAVNSEEGYLWFSLRDPALLPSTLLWVENGGRHRPPWNGRNCCLGIEDVCSYFDCGSTSSAAANAFSERGYKTVQQFVSEHPLSIPYIQGIVSTPPGFSHVHAVRCDSFGATFADAAGREVTSHLCAEFIFGYRL